MKKLVLIALAWMLFSLHTYSQTCEQREEKIKSTLASFSAATLYNTYGLVGSIADGVVHEVYNDEMAHNLLDAQKKLMDNLIRVLDELARGRFVTRKDSVYTSSSILILNGLKKQAELLQDYCNNKGRKKLDASEEQRRKNWADISKLMGIKE